MEEEFIWLSVRAGLRLRKNNQDCDQWESSQRIAEVRRVWVQIGVHLKFNPGR